MGKKIPVTSIDTGIPVPERATYPLNELKVGESFLFPVKKRGSVQTRVSSIKSISDKDFTIKKMDEETCRVWRTK